MKCTMYKLKGFKKIAWCSKHKVFEYIRDMDIAKV